MTLLINLLPWRESRQQKKQAMIMVYLGLSVLILFLLQTGFYVWFATKITIQNKRNTFLMNEMKHLEIQTQELQTWIQNKNTLLNKAIKVHHLQVHGMEMVRILDALPRWVPPGLYLTSFSQSRHQLLLQGKAESHEVIATFMRNINQSNWLQSLQLMLSQNDKSQTDGVAFQLRAINPALHDEE